MNEAVSVTSGTRDPEAHLVQAAIAGDTGAFASLYDAHLERVYRHVYYLVGNRSDAEDLTQQAFLQAWRAIGRFRPSGAPFVAWLLMIAHNTAMQHHRRARETAPLDVEMPSAARWADPETAALQRAEGDAVRRAILRLREDQRQVILLRFVEDLDHATVAAALGKSEANVRVIQHRALVDLRRLLSHEVRP